jgi:putative intracellular protease/amidase
MKLRVGVLLYPGFELLDVYGPLEMFASLGAERVSIHLIAETAGPIAAAIGLEGASGPKSLAEHSFDDAPPLDVLLVPGGIGTIPALANERMLTFIRARAKSTPVVASVCSGSALLAKAGILDGKRATSNKQFFSLASSQSDNVKWVEAARWVDEGNVVTSSGVSAGMDMALALIARLVGPEAAEAVSIATEYTWHRNAAVDPFVKYLNKGGALA